VTDYTLHCFVESGNAYKVALMLQLAGADWQPVWNDFFRGGSRTPEFLALNEMGEVPVLVDHTQDDLTLSQSALILWHLADRYDQFAARNANEHREVLRWMFWDNHKLTSYIATYRFLVRFAGKEGSPEAEFMKGRAISAIKVFERHLTGRDWVAADRPTIADISCAGYLFWPDHYGMDWKDFPAIAAWTERLKTLKNWAAPEAILPSGPQG